MQRVTADVGLGQALGGLGWIDAPEVFDAVTSGCREPMLSAVSILPVGDRGGTKPVRPLDLRIVRACDVPAQLN